MHKIHQHTRVLGWVGYNKGNFSECKCFYANYKLIYNFKIRLTYRKTLTFKYER